MWTWRQIVCVHYLDTICTIVKNKKTIVANAAAEPLSTHCIPAAAASSIRHKSTQPPATDPLWPYPSHDTQR